MAYELKPENAKMVSKPEVAFGTTKFLPEWEDIPEEFKRGNVYTRYVEGIFYKGDYGSGKVEINPEWEEILNEGNHLIGDFISAHLRSWEPKHEHKIAGVGYMVSLITTFKD